MKNQKGFIPIIFIIIGAVVLASATFGVVKHKDEITANISKVFKPKKIEIFNIDSMGGDEVTEEPELVEEPIIEEPEQDDAQQLQEQLRIAEQKRLEAEKRLAEEKARQEAKIRAEQELQRQLEAQRIAEEQQRQEELQRQQDSLIKVELCKNEAEQQRAEFLSITETTLKERIKDNLQKYKNESDECVAKAEQRWEQKRKQELGKAHSPQVWSLWREQYSQDREDCHTIFYTKKYSEDLYYQKTMEEYRKKADELYRTLLNRCLSE